MNNRKEMLRMSDSTALVDTIVALMDGREWNADVCDKIAGLLRGAGHTIRDISDVEDEARVPDVRWERTATFAMLAPSMEDAESMWEADGPECGPEVNLVHVGELEAACEPTNGQINDELLAISQATPAQRARLAQLRSSGWQVDVTGLRDDELTVVALSPRVGEFYQAVAAKITPLGVLSF